jgi:hypothetical protein
LEIEEGGLEGPVKVIENMFATHRQLMEDSGLEPNLFGILNRSMVYQFECQGENIFQTETVVYCDFEKDPQAFNNDPNAIINKLLASGWVEQKNLDSILEHHREHNREKLVNAFIQMKGLAGGKPTHQQLHPPCS